MEVTVGPVGGGVTGGAEPPPPHPANSSPRLVCKNNAAYQPRFFMELAIPLFPALFSALRTRPGGPWISTQSYTFLKSPESYHRHRRRPEEQAVPHPESKHLA